MWETFFSQLLLSTRISDIDNSVAYDETLLKLSKNTKVA